MSIAIGNPASEMLWARILSLLEQRRVIPIIGEDAVMVADETGPCTIGQYVAGRLEQLLDLPRTAPPQRSTLNEVACRYLDATRAQSLDEVYAAVHLILRQQPPEVPDTLRKLARIRAFTLYVTTTFDDLLQRALAGERGITGMQDRVFAYSPARLEDIPYPIDRITEPTVFHLLGRASALPEYVLTEEDTLEFVHSLQSVDRSPKLLLDALRSHSLLIIGSGYSGWLARFFLRIARSERLFLARLKSDVVADARLRDDPSLRSFLQHFSADTRVIDSGAEEFIDELAVRWDTAAVGNEAFTPHDPERGRVGSGAAGTGGEVPDDAIFLSYASEDSAAVEILANALHSVDLPVWLDRAGGLHGGDDYERKIRMRIQSASLFVPVLSRHVLTPQRRFFRLEWDEAMAVQRRVAENQSFIVPVCIDDLSRDAPQLPGRFTRLHWLDVSSPAGVAAAVQRLQALYREYQWAIGPAT